MTKKATTISYDATIYSAKGTKASTMTLPEKVFGLKWNGDLVHEVVTSMLANKRAGTAHTKDRSEVSGGGKKPWKQKGTGQARHGSNRSPIWVGGGITHGPRNEKDYSKKINKKARVKALFTILSKQYASGAVLLVDDLALSTIKTKDAQAVLTNLAKVESFAKLGGGKRTTTLVVVPELTDTITKSFANLAGAMVLVASGTRSAR
jgi:large subunit ribosomal protein L4